MKTHKRKLLINFSFFIFFLSFYYLHYKIYILTKVTTKAKFNLIFHYIFSCIHKCSRAWWSNVQLFCLLNAKKYAKYLSKRLHDKLASQFERQTRGWSVDLLCISFSLIHYHFQNRFSIASQVSRIFRLWYSIRSNIHPHGCPPPSASCEWFQRLPESDLFWRSQLASNSHVVDRGGTAASCRWSRVSWRMLNARELHESPSNVECISSMRERN